MVKISVWGERWVIEDGVSVGVRLGTDTGAYV